MQRLPLRQMRWDEAEKNPRANPRTAAAPHPAHPSMAKAPEIAHSIIQTMKSLPILAAFAALALPALAQRAGTLPENIDFDVLRKLIKQSTKKPEIPAGKQKLAILKELKFDRSTAGILATRLEEEARMKRAWKSPRKSNPPPSQLRSRHPPK